MKIGIFGKMRSGKTMLADYYKEVLDAEVIDFSDSLKQAATIIFPKEMSGKAKNRELLIMFGQHMRKLDSEVWVKNVQEKILNSKKKNIIVTGIRQKNEYDLLKRLGFVFIRVDAPLETRLERIKSEGDNFKSEHLQDATEVELLNFEFDYLINNDRSLKDLIIDASNILEDISSGDKENV